MKNLFSWLCDTICLHPPVFRILAWITGVFSAQIIASAMVALSNKALYNKMQAISEAGYQSVPNQLILDSLLHFKTAWMGGWFFALTCGGAVSFFGYFYGSVFGSGQAGKRNLIPVVIIGIFLALAASGTVFLPFVWALVFIPFCITFFLGGITKTKIHKKFRPIRTCIMAGVFFQLFLISMENVEIDTFGKLRDRLMLTSPAGRMVMGLYYDYTMYAAHVFKSTNQKLMNPVYICPEIKGKNRRQLKTAMSRINWFPIQKPRYAEVLIQKDKNSLLLFNQNQKEVVKTDLKRFISSPGKAEERFSVKTDKYLVFRGFVLACLLVMTCLTVFMLGLFLLYLFEYILGFIYELIRIGFSKKDKQSPLHWFSMKRIALFFLSVWLLYGFGSFFRHTLYIQTIPETREKISQALISGQADEQARALEAVNQKSLEITTFHGYEKLVKSPCLLVRYKLITSLFHSTQRDSVDQLILMLDDPHFFIRYNACHVLGKKGNRKARDAILMRLPEMKHWYVQLYAFQAARRLGWNPAG